MATTKMSELGYRDILVREGFHPPYTMDVNSAAVFPGFVLTGTGETFPAVSVADAIGDNCIGVAGLLENQDIDTVYATGDEIPVYLTGCGAIVKVFHGADVAGDIEAGDILVAQTTTALGHVETLKNAFDTAVAAAMHTALATAIAHLWAIVGRSLETHASAGDAYPIKIILSV